MSTDPTPLQNSIIRLVPLAEEHIPDLAEIITDAAVLRFTRVPEPPPEGFERTWLARYEAGRANGTREGFAIVDVVDGAFCGLAVAPRIEREARTAELGYLVTARARGRGVASAALRLLTQWAFAELQAVRLELVIAVDNEASKSVARNAGYTKEGVLRSLYFKQERWQDSEIWSRLSSDP